MSCSTCIYRNELIGTAQNGIWLQFDVCRVRYSMYSGFMLTVLYQHSTSQRVYQQGGSGNVEGGVHIVCRPIGTNFVVLQPLPKVVHRGTALLRCIKAWLTDIYITQEDYGITWFIRWSSSRLLCEVAKCSYAFGHPKYGSTPVIVAQWYLWWKAFECWRQQPSSAFQVVCYNHENRHVSAVVDKNEQTRTAQPIFFYSVYFTIQEPSRISMGKVKDEGLKELWHDLFLKMAHFPDWCETKSFISYTARSFRSPWDFSYY